MVHCNPAPPHPPPGELYSVVCLGRPYINGFPVGYAVYAVIMIMVLLIWWLTKNDSTIQTFER